MAGQSGKGPIPAHSTAPGMGVGEVGHVTFHGYRCTGGVREPCVSWSPRRPHVGRYCYHFADGRTAVWWRGARVGTRRDWLSPSHLATVPAFSQVCLVD